MLTNTQILNAKPKKKNYKLSDARGLVLEVTSAGSKRWRMRYRLNGREKMLSLGLFPDVGLKLAREKADKIRQQLADGIDPSEQRKIEQQEKEVTFELVAMEYIERQSKKWGDKHKHTFQTRLERYLFPAIGKKPIRDITAPQILPPLRKIEAQGFNNTAHRILQSASQIFRYGIATGVAERDPARDLEGALAPVVSNNRAALTDPRDLAEFLRLVDAYNGHFVTICALKLLPMVFLRPTELVAATWSEFHLEAAEWRIPANRMKLREEHIVPLSRQAMEILQTLRPLAGKSDVVFPSINSRTRNLSTSTLNVALRRMGYKPEDVSAAGFRATASTMLNELGWNRDVIERQMAHRERNKVRGAYNHAEYLPERKKLMQAWADYLDALKGGAKVIP